MIAAKELEANMCLTKQKDILPTKVVFVLILLKQHFSSSCVFSCHVG